MPPLPPYSHTFINHNTYRLYVCLCVRFIIYLGVRGGRGIIGEKALNFADFVRVAELMKEKVHLTKEGLDQILEIGSGMNTGRDFESSSSSGSEG